VQVSLNVIVQKKEQLMEKEKARKAAKWWADQLRGHAKLDNGDPTSQGGVTFCMASLLQSKEKEKQTPEQINLFEDKLTEIILNKSIKAEKLNMPIWLGCDYGPDQTLSDAAQEANLKLGMTTLPWKTNMKIKDNIEVSCGYGAQYVEI